MVSSGHLQFFDCVEGETSSWGIKSSLQLMNDGLLIQSKDYGIIYLVSQTETRHSRLRFVGGLCWFFNSVSDPGHNIGKILPYVQAQELLSNIAMLELAVSKLEHEIVSLHFQLSQERNERRLAEYRLRHSSLEEKSLCSSGILQVLVIRILAVKSTCSQLSQIL